MFTRLSAKTIQEIAFYLSSSVDLHSLSLTNKHVHTALQDGLVYRQCIINAGWDVTDWSFDRPEWQSDEFYTYMLAKMQDLKLWKATCGTYTRMESFMERATVDDNLYFYHQNPLPALSFPSWGAPLVDCGARIIPFHKFDPKKYGLYEEADVGHGEVKVIDGQRAFRWMRHMGEFLLLISIDTHTKNVPRLLQDKFMGTWSVSLRALIGLSFVPTLVQGSDHPDVPKEYLELYYSNALERFSFSFLYLLLQSDKTCLESRSLSRLDYPAWFALIDQYFDPTSSDFVRDMFQVRADRQRPELLLRRFNVCFLVQILILLRVHCHHVVLGDEEDATFEYLFPDLDVPTLGESPAELKHGIAGTPLESMYEDGPGASMTWEGYCIDQNGPYWHKDAPQTMDFLLMAASPEDGFRATKKGVWLKGVGGDDGEEPILLAGFCDKRVGTVWLNVFRDGRNDSFRGVVTPFGMSGRWDCVDEGKTDLGGWWWFWPVPMEESDDGDGSWDSVMDDDEDL